jgi:hypothetical protein
VQRAKSLLGAEHGGGVLSAFTGASEFQQERLEHAEV